MNNIPAGKVLRRAAELVDMGHCKDTPARDEMGRYVYATAPSAVSWCLTGAMRRAWAELHGETLAEWPYSHAPWPEITAATGAAVRQGLATTVGHAVVPGYEVEWNNAPKRTADEVSGLLRRAADLADATPPSPARPT